MSGAGNTVTEKLLVCRCTGELASFTAIVNDVEPVTVGTPERTPAEVNVRPAGRLPEATDQVYPAVPPPAEKAAVYVAPFCALLKLAVVIVSADGAMDRAKAFVCVCARVLASLTTTVKLLSPADVGVPARMPALLRLRPTGRLPDINDHVYSCMPPLA